MTTPIISTHPLDSFALAYAEQGQLCEAQLTQLDQFVQKEWQ
jgi:hypothetical protein